MFIYLFVALNFIYSITKEQKNSMKIIKELQDDIATMRKDGPQYYTQILNKEFTAMRNNFVNKQRFTFWQ